MMRAKRKRKYFINLLLVVAFVVALSSCSSTKSTEPEGAFLSRLASPGALVMKAEGSSIKALGEDIKEDYMVRDIIGRTERIEAQILMNTEVSPHIVALLHGDFPRIGVYMLLKYDPHFRGVGEGHYAHYERKDGKYSIGVFAGGDLLFTTVPFDEAYSLYKSSGKGFMDAASLSFMEENPLSIYSEEPEDLEGIGLPLTKETVDKMERVLLSISLSGDEALISGSIEMEDERAARTLNTALRNEIIKELKREGERRLDTEALKHIVNYDKENVTIDGYSVGRKNILDALTRALDVFKEDNKK